ncbi:hypothetical protein COJ77_18345 [Bacillus cereus]|nr:MULTISPECIES: heparinase II/III family protein [Bacillus cereus group]PFO80421.1 hypothetical protein COJ77_18345 [Bacillus cereus]
MKPFIPSYLTGEGVEAILNVLPHSRNKDYLKAAEFILKRNSYTLPPFGVIKYSHLIDWEDNRSRSYLRLIHGQTFLGCLTDGYRETRNVRYIVKGIELIQDWLKNYSFEKKQNSMAFHDETTALRMQYWLRFYIFAKEALPQDNYEMLEKAMCDTAALLADEEFHATNTNHGMFQDIALLLFAVYFEGEIKECKAYKELAGNRLKRYFECIFTEDGVHKEHSPSYHMLVTSYVKKLAVFLVEVDKEMSQTFIEIYKKTEPYATYIIRPDGYFPPICDTESKLVGTGTYRRLYDSQEYLYATSKGEKGRAPKETDKVFPKAGYAIFRDDWAKKEKGTYVLFTAAYNADYHKHSDDLNLYIYSDGEIITEAGPNGYNYQDPFTKYAYSSFAHNTLVVDGKGLPRTDQKYDKVYLSDYEITDDRAEATGINLRYEGVEHQRNVKYFKQNKTIVVQDSIASEKSHEYKLLWHVASDIVVHVRDRFVELFRGNKKVMEMEIQTDAPVRINTLKGQTKPQMGGWVFPKMEENQIATTIEVDLNGSNIECKTEFRLDSFKLGKEGILPYQFEEVFDSTRSVRYSFEEATDPKYSDKLFIIFSAMSPKYNFVFNYMKSLQEAPVNKLFILDDFGDQGSYYLGNQRDHTIETGVASLIQYIMAKYGIPHKNVTTIGSSKGGYAALYFALKYYLGNVIAGGPQSKIGSFLIDQADHSNVAHYISGGTGEGDCHYLNQLIFQVLNQPNEVSPNINMMVGKRDHHYSNHVMPLYNVLLEKGYKVDLEVKDGLTHNDLKVHFPLYLQEKVNEILGEQIYLKPNIQEPVIKSVDVKQVKENKFVVNCDAIGVNIQYAYYIYRDREIIEKIMYRTSPQMDYEVKTPGKYMVKVFVRDFNKQVVSSNTKTIEL